MYIFSILVIYYIWRDILCGICGYIDNKNITNDKHILDMTHNLSVNKSDLVTTYINNNIALGSNNETITRVISGRQYTIVYNGRLYNRNIIEDKLKTKGYCFNSKSEAEIVLFAYMEYKLELMEFLDGIFAFAIYNTEKDELFIARDKLGIYPLYYYNGEQFVFASKIKSILTHPNIIAKISKDELCEIFGLGPAHSPGKTFFKDIYELKPGHFGVYTNENFKTYKYWDLETKEINDTLDESIKKVKKLVIDSVQKELNYNGNICSMLSGGLDSSVLAYIASLEKKNLATFSIDFKNNDINFKETAYQPTRDSDYVNIMKDFLHTNHSNLYFSTTEIYSSLKEAMLAREMPGMADVDSSMLVFCKKIKEKGYDMAISGECSDEIFGGYPWYYKEHLINSRAFPWSRSIDTRKNIINNNLVSPEYLEQYVNNAFQSTSNNVVYNSPDPYENTFRKTCYNTVKWFMNTLVERTVRISNSTGLDIRVPFADYKIFDYVYNVCAKYKLGLVDENNTLVEKYLLRKAFENELPHDVVYRKKSPFPKTYDPEYTKLLEDNIKEIINKSTSPLLELINVRYLYEILDSKGENLKENWFGQLMTYPQTLAYLIQINMWLEEYDVKVEI